MAGMKENCWEFMDCGYEAECRVCEARKFDGVHGGRNAGRVCWKIKDNLCGFKVNDECNNCDFYRSVLREEGMDFMLDEELDMME